MLIPIPIGTKHVAAVQGAVWKFVSCGHCQQRYAYQLELEATGENHDLLFLDGEGSAERARAQAEQNLLQKSRNVVVPVPCPSCGFYQDDMSRKLKEEVSVNSLQIAGGVIAVLSLVPLAFGIPYIWRPPYTPSAHRSCSRVRPRGCAQANELVRSCRVRRAASN